MTCILFGFLILNILLLQLKTVRVCGPRYWPQVIELNPEGGYAYLQFNFMLTVLYMMICILWLVYLFIVLQRNLGGMVGRRRIRLIPVFCISNVKLELVPMWMTP